MVAAGAVDCIKAGRQSLRCLPPPSWLEAESDELLAAAFRPSADPSLPASADGAFVVWWDASEPFGWWRTRGCEPFVPSGAELRAGAPSPDCEVGFDVSVASPLAGGEDAVVESFTGSSCFSASELCPASSGSETTLVGFVADGVLTAVVAAAALESLVFSSAFARSVLRVADLTEAVEASAELDDDESVDSVVWLVASWSEG